MSEPALSAPRLQNIGARTLRRQLRRTERKRKLMAIGLIAPLFLFIAVNFVVPLGIILVKSVDDREVSRILPRTTEVLSDWTGEGTPDEFAFEALFLDIQQATRDKTLVKAAKRLNSGKSGFNALILKTSRRLSDVAAGSYRQAMLDVDERWGERPYWLVLKRTGKPFTLDYMLAAVDLTVNEEGEIVQVPEHSRVFLVTWVRTFWMALVITGVCVLLGYPLAYLIATVPSRFANLILILVLIPFWTSLLVRTTAWLVLLQDQGIVNDLGLSLHLWSERLQLMHNRTGVYITMTHVLLPYMVLPIYGAMKRIPSSYMRAARSLGAHPLLAFLKVYLPLTTQGVGAGSLFVFILAIGFYITPALVGGPQDQMISYFIAFYTNEVLNWGAAAALSTILLFVTMAIFWAFKSVFGLDRMQMR